MTSLKIGAVVLLMLLCFGAGWYSNNKEPIVETQTQVVEKVITKTITEKVSNPDGTTTEKTTQETTEDKATKAKEKEPVPQVAQTLPSYSIGVQFTPRLFRDERYIPTGMDLGYRVIGNAWATAGYSWHTKEVTLGLRIEF
jgi:hypothetical protein